MTKKDINKKFFEKIIFIRKTANKKLIKKTLLLSIIIVLLITISFLIIILKSINNSIITKNIINSELNRNMTEINDVSEDNGIKMQLNGVIADGDRIILSATFSLSNKAKMTPNGLSLLGVSLKDNDNSEYRLFNYGKGGWINGSKSYNTTIEFDSSPIENSDMNLTITNINGIDGIWSFNFNITPIMPTIFESNSNYDDGKIAIDINSVEFTATSTILKGNNLTKNIFDNTYEKKLTNGIDNFLLISGSLADDEFELKFPAMNISDNIIFIIQNKENKNDKILLNINLK